MTKQSKKLERRRTAARRGSRRRVERGAVLAAGAILAVWGVLWLGSRSEPSGRLAAGTPAPGFTLASTDGRTVALDDLRGENVLLYFNEGAGCGSCFTQLVEMERHRGHLEELNTTLVPVSPNPAEVIIGEASAYGVRSPYLVDQTLEVARAYDVLGRGHHAGLPGHSFILVDAEGRYRWRGDYPGMWVEPMELVGEVASALDA